MVTYPSAAPNTILNLFVPGLMDVIPENITCTRWRTGFAVQEDREFDILTVNSVIEHLGIAPRGVR